MYGKAFEILFKSFKGDWRVELSQKDYVGAVTQLKGGADVANFTLNNQGDDKHKPLKSFMAQLQVEVATHGQLAGLFGSDAQKTLCKAYLNDSLYFHGFVTPDDYSESLQHPPYDLELQAICGLGLLQGIDFLHTDGSWYTGRLDKLEVIRLILEKIGSHELPMYIASGMYEKRMDQNKNALSQQYVNVETYVSSDGDPLSCYDVLSDLLLGYRFLQQDGAWHAAQLNLLDGTPYLADHYEMYIGQFTRQGSILVSPKVEIFDKTKPKYNGYVRGSQLEKKIEGAKKLTSTQDYQLIRNLFKSGDYQNSDWEPYPSSSRNMSWRLISKFPDNKVEYARDAVYGGKVVADKRIPVITSYGGELKDSFPIKTMAEGENYLKVQLILSAVNYYISTYPAALIATNWQGTTADVDVMVKLGDYYLTKDGWEQSAEPIKVTQEITSGAIESKFDLSFIVPTIPIEGNLEVSIFGKTEKAIAVHDVRVFFTREDLELAGSNELVGIQNPLKANVLDDLTLLTGDVPELTNFDSVWRGGLTLADGSQTKDWQALGNALEYDHGELISRIVLGGYSRDIHTLSATMEADINAISIIYDKYTGRNYGANGITYNVKEDEWSGEWIEVMPYEYAGANFNASQVSSSREGNYTKTSQTNDFAVYGNGETGTGKRLYELPVASDLAGAKFMLDKAGWPEAKCTDISIFARKDLDNHFVGQTIEGPLVVNGPITQNGASYITHAQHVEVENNLMQLNKGEAGSQITGLIPGTSIAFSGQEINRGSGESYYFGIVEGSKPLFKLGKKTSLETLATREDSPLNNGVMLWDDANHRMKAVAAAPDSDKLGNVAATNYARTDIEEVFNQRVKFKGNIENDGFTEGLLTGSGYRMTPDGTIQADYLELRKGLTVTELIISKERSINGGLVTSIANGEVKSVNGDVVTLKGEYNSFIVGDRVRLQDWNAGSRYMEAEITAVSGLTITLGNYNTATRPKEGDSLVQWGHKDDPSRQSFLYQTSRGGGFFAVYNGVNSASLANKEVVRMGNLSNDNVGLISEYEGKRFFELSNNRKEIAGCEFDETHLWTAGWAMHHNGNFSLGKGQINYDVATNKVSFGEDVTLNWGQVEGAQAAIDAIEIGGENIIPGTSTGEGWFRDYYEGATFSQTAASVNETSYIYSPYFLLPANTEIILSFESKNDADITSRDLFILPDDHGALGLLASTFSKSTEWKKFTFKFTTPSTWGTSSNPTSVRLRIDHNGSISGNSASIWARNIKLEYGNKATSWSPASEDVNASIDTAQNTADSAKALAESKTDAWATQITKDTVTAEFLRTRNLIVGDHIQMGPEAVISWDKVTDKTAVTNGISTAQSTANDANALAGTANTNAGNAQSTANTAVNDAATAQGTANSAKATAESKTDEWATTISKNAITAEFLKTRNLIVGDHIQMGPEAVISWDKVSGGQAAIDAIEIGGRNMVPFSKGDVTTGWQAGVEVVDSFSAFYQVNSSTGENYIWSPYFNAKGGETYTISFWYKNTSNVSSKELYLLPSNYGTIGNYWAKSVPDSLEWSFFTHTFTLYEGFTDMRFRFDNNGSTDGNDAKIWVRHVKVEKGNKATDWTPAPEDVDASIATKVTSAEATQITKDTIETTNVVAANLFVRNIKTSTSGKRIEISAEYNKLQFFNAENSEVVKIDDDIYTNTPGIKITEGILYMYGANMNVLNCTRIYKDHIQTLHTRSRQLASGITYKSGYGDVTINADYRFHYINKLDSGSLYLPPTSGVEDGTEIIIFNVTNYNNVIKATTGAKWNGSTTTTYSLNDKGNSISFVKYGDSWYKYNIDNTGVWG